MKQHLLKLSLSVFLLLAMAPVFAYQTIYIVRHAEKVDESRDPDLSEKGQQRAAKLANMLRDAQVKKILVTEFKRTQQTAKVLADSQQITHQIIEGKELDLLVAELKASKESVLVVGHSNTVPALLKKLGMLDVQAVADDEYDRLTVVNNLKTAQAIFNTLRY